MVSEGLHQMSQNYHERFVRYEHSFRIGELTISITRDEQPSAGREGLGRLSVSNDRTTIGPVGLSRMSAIDLLNFVNRIVTDWKE